MSDAIGGIVQGQLSIGDAGSVIDADRKIGGLDGGATGESGGASVPFVSLFEDALRAANDAGQVADKKTTEFATGKSDDIHGTMIAVKQADVELHLVGTVKSKIVDAINDLLRTSI